MIRFENVNKIYRKGKAEIKALDSVSLKVEAGEFVVLQGPSGSGKTTLLLMAGGMLSPSKGDVTACGRQLYSIGSGARARVRAQKIGFVFQNYHLVPYLSALENVLLARGACPAAAGSGKKDSNRSEAAALLEELNLADRTGHKPSELSTGERQRTAIARALLNRPEIVLADEPTGNLDPDCAKEVLDHLAAFNKQGRTVVLVTHGEAAKKHASRVLRMRQGCLVLEAATECRHPEETECAD